MFINKKDNIFSITLNKTFDLKFVDNVIDFIFLNNNNIFINPTIKSLNIVIDK